MSKSAREALAEMFRSAREAKGLSQSEFGVFLGVTGSYISKLESGANGAPSIELVMLLVEKFGVKRKPALQALKDAQAEVQSEKWNRAMTRAGAEGT